MIGPQLPPGHGVRKQGGPINIVLSKPSTPQKTFRPNVSNIPARNTFSPSSPNVSSQKSTPSPLSKFNGTKQGLVGLSNLGNTCFMNSALQCLFQTPILTDYFLQNRFQSQLNRDNPLGFKGRVAESYAALLKRVWSGEAVIAPQQFKGVLGAFAPRFNGYEQQDSSELLSFLLDGLHEDLNQVKKKPQTTAVESDGQDDEGVARESWRRHLLRNRSIIVDVFQGQLKSTLVCPTCHRTAVKFDPFMMLSVPLPQLHARRFLFVPLHSPTGVVQYGVMLLSDENGARLKSLLANLVGCPPGELMLTVVNPETNAIVKMIKDTESVAEFAQRSVRAYRVVQHGTGRMRLLHVFHEKQDNQSEQWRVVGRSFLLRFAVEEPLAHLYSLIRDKVDKGQCELKFSESERGAFLGPPADCDLPEYLPNVLGLVNISIRWATSVPKCATRLTMHSSVAEIKRREHTKDVLELGDCLDLFTREERLSPSEAWFCSKCKDFRQATKKLDIWQAPDVLIIHLKRLYPGRKVDTPVHFPIEGLDMARYCKRAGGISVEAHATLPLSDPVKSAPLKGGSREEVDYVAAPSLDPSLTSSSSSCSSPSSSCSSPSSSCSSPSSSCSSPSSSCSSPPSEAAPPIGVVVAEGQLLSNCYDSSSDDEQPQSHTHGTNNTNGIKNTNGTNGTHGTHSTNDGPNGTISQKSRKRSRSPKRKRSRSSSSSSSSSRSRSRSRARRRSGSRHRRRARSEKAKKKHKKRKHERSRSKSRARKHKTTKSSKKRSKSRRGRRRSKSSSSSSSSTSRSRDASKRRTRRNRSRSSSTSRSKSRSRVRRKSRRSQSRSSKHRRTKTHRKASKSRSKSREKARKQNDHREDLASKTKSENLLTQKLELSQNSHAPLSPLPKLSQPPHPEPVVATPSPKVPPPGKHVAVSPAASNGISSAHSPHSAGASAAVRSAPSHVHSPTPLTPSSALASPRSVAPSPASAVTPSPAASPAPSPARTPSAPPASSARTPVPSPAPTPSSTTPASSPSPARTPPSTPAPSPAPAPSPSRTAPAPSVPTGADSIQASLPTRGAEEQKGANGHCENQDMLSNGSVPVKDLYDLYAISHHMGSAFGGHYTAVVKSLANGLWYCMDDSTTTRQEPNPTSKTAYVLFYRRRNCHLH